jgi:hypothetical protein
MKSPLSLVKEKFTDKKKLVEAVQKFTGEELWVARESKNKGLAHVSNAKLLRLHATFSQVKEKFGTRFKLIDAIVALENRKDEGYRNRLLAYPVPRLWDIYKSADKRKGNATPAADKDATGKEGAPKAKAKAASAAKTPATKKAAPAAAAAAPAKKKTAPKA